MEKFGRKQKNHLKASPNDFSFNENDSTQENSMATSNLRVGVLSFTSPIQQSSQTLNSNIAGKKISNTSSLSLASNFHKFHGRVEDSDKHSYSQNRCRTNSENGLIHEVQEASLKSDDYHLKHKTEICKNFEFRGDCPWGLIVSLSVLFCPWRARAS